MKNVISIQSHVVFGCVGNKSAILPMQLLGIDVWPIHTVQFSNHTQFKSWRGMVIPDEQIMELGQGLDDIEQLQNCDAILSGYIGSEKQGRSILKFVNKVKSLNPNAVFLCDPVMSSAKKGTFVAKGISDFFINEALTVADYITPNLNELSILSDMEITNFTQVIEATEKLLTKGLKKIVVKHLDKASLNVGEFEMIMATPEKILHVSRPLYQCKNPNPVGVGDLISAIFLANILNDKSDTAAFELMNNIVNDVMLYTSKSNATELQLVGARNLIIKPTSNFKANIIK